MGSNFLVPKDGTPILGLIQDHVVSGVLMTIRGQFFNKEDFMHLVLSAFSETTKRIKVPSPVIIKPITLWSGKQVWKRIWKNLFHITLLILKGDNGYCAELLSRKLSRH